MAAAEPNGSRNHSARGAQHPDRQEPPPVEPPGDDVTYFDEPLSRESHANATVALEEGMAEPLAATDNAEEALVAAVLGEPGTYDDVADIVGAGDFTVPAYRDIWDAVLTCDAQGQPIDVVTVAEVLDRGGRLTRLGGVAGLRDICSRVALHPDHAAVYAGLVADRALGRRVSTVGRDIVAYSAREAQSGADALEFAEAAVLGVARNDVGDGGVAMSVAVPATLKELAEIQGRNLLGYSSGFRGLDLLTSGFQGGQLITLAARPGMGKSAMAWQLAKSIASTSQQPVAFVSYEMSTTELMVRALASSLGVPLGDLRRGDLPAGAELELGKHARKLAQLPIIVDDRPPVTITGLRSSMRRLSRRGPLAAIIVDYLQLMGGDRFSAGQNRTAEVSEISRGLKLLARELDVAIVALSQLNRNVEQRPSKKPLLSDLRESGSIEQDSDTVLAIYREHVYHPEADPTDARLLVLKQRQGAQGEIPLEWDGPSTRFLDRAPGWDPGPEPLRNGRGGAEPW